MRDVVILGVGMTKFGISNLSQKEMFAEAALDALQESQVKAGDLQALFVGNVLGDFEEGQINIAPFLAAEIGMRPEAPATRFECACASATVAVRHAVLMVRSGECDVVMAGGTERTAIMGTPLATKTFAMGSHSEYERFSGITFPGVFGMVAHQYAAKYGIPLESLKHAMAGVAVKNHKNGVLNPLAHFRKEISIDTVLQSPMIADPLQLFDCCPFSDGAAAIVIADAERYKDRVEKPILVAGTGQGSAGPVYRQKDLTRMAAREASAKRAYEEAGVGPSDIDVIELHDCFTIAEVVALEMLGIFDFGAAPEAIERGDTALDGKIPVNPSGGLKAKGHPIGATGAAQTYEIVKQLRGECGDRQVKDAEVGLVDTLGGDFSTVCTLVLRRY
ncbi:MAG: beta-ketoacyl synthase N-terminal-like domain-containing protein [Desulfomonilaceae bacterium]|nr:beta-ketoacyl synthase N-terminal-like domain-containing protein [Desulfomonilaceae bacterium]